MLHKSRRGRRRRRTARANNDPEAVTHGRSRCQRGKVEFKESTLAAARRLISSGCQMHGLRARSSKGSAVLRPFRLFLLLGGNGRPWSQGPLGVIHHPLGRAPEYPLRACSRTAGRGGGGCSPDFVLASATVCWRAGGTVTPGSCFSSAPWWAYSMMVCHVIAGSAPPVMRGWSRHSLVRCRTRRTQTKVAGITRHEPGGRDNCWWCRSLPA